MATIDDDVRLENMTKEQLIRLFLRSEKIRKKQAEVIDILNKELDDYVDIALEKTISEMIGE